MINKLSILKFKCIPELTLQFKSQTNLIVGNNSTGKTTILQAARMAMSYYLKKMELEHDESLDFEKADFHDKQPLGRPPKQKDVQLCFEFPLFHGKAYSYMATQYIYISPKNVEKYPTTHFLETTPKHLSAPMDIKRKAAPLMACYFINGDNTRPLPPEEMYTPRRLHRTFAYNECLHAGYQTPRWLKRLQTLMSARKEIVELRGVTDALKAVCGEKGLKMFCGIWYIPDTNTVWFTSDDGREFSYQSLSTGYRRIIDLVLDLAFRCMILNGNVYGAEAPKHTEGTILIDDIDLHLNPHFQTTILKALKKTFPNLQMIISTHAPIIMSQTNGQENNIVYVIYQNDRDRTICAESNLYGMNVADIHELVMQAPSRSGKAAREFNELSHLYDTGQLDEANLLLDKLRIKYGDDLFEIIRMETLLTTFDDDLFDDDLFDDELIHAFEQSIFPTIH